MFPFPTQAVLAGLWLGAFFLSLGMVIAMLIWAIKPYKKLNDRRNNSPD